MLKNKNILVTGGAGYIGSHACKALANAGYTPITFDNLVYGHSWAVKWGPLEIGDIHDKERLLEVVNRYKPGAVMHFAAYAYVGESVQDPGKYYRNNVSGTISLLEIMRDQNINKMIFSSTCATYGLPCIIPIQEDHPQTPINPYGRSKWMIERILEDFDRAHSLRSISLRYFNAAGADVDGQIGELHSPETHLIPLILDVAFGNKSSLDIYGDDYETPDGTCIRDYIHVSDLANAHVLALDHLCKGGASSFINLANGSGYSVKEIINSVEKITGKKIHSKIRNRREGDPPVLIGDASRAKATLGWDQKYGDIDQIVESAWRWYLSLQN